jgi:chaperonin GroES
MSDVNIKPLEDRVLVLPQPAEERTASGIIIPDSAKEKPQKGTIVAVGEGNKDVTMQVKVGDTVLYGKYAGTELSVDGNDYLIMRQSDILAVV